MKTRRSLDECSLPSVARVPYFGRLVVINVVVNAEFVDYLS